MKYYSIKYSTTKEIGGTFPQSIRSIHYSPEESIYRNLWNPDAIIPKKFVYPTPILENSAKLTDLLSHSGFYSFSLLVSEKLKDILIMYSLREDLFNFETTVINKNGEFKYWALGPLISRDEYIDFENSIIQVQKGDLSETISISVKNIEEYKELLEKEFGVNYIKISKISFNQTNKPDFFSIRHMYDAKNYIVSEKLRQIILDSKFTGITFEEFT